MSKIPTIIGVPGHRNINKADIAEIEALVEIELRSLKAHCFDGSLIVMSALAEGADRIVATVSLSLGIPLVVPLPFELGEYEKDFSSRASIEEFRRLLTKASDYYVVGKSVSDSYRDAAYEDLALHLARHSQILLALWDGEHNNKPGSTSRVVQLTLGTCNRSLVGPNDARVVHIHTVRSGGSVPEKPGKVRSLYADEDGRTYAHVMKTLFDINTDINRYSGVVDNHHQLKLGAPTYCDHAIVGMQKVSDAISSSAKKHTNSSTILLFVFALIMVISYDLYTYDIATKILGPLYICLFILGSYIVSRGRKLRFHENFVNYRSLAEALRIQHFWRAVGIPKNAGDFYQYKHFDDTIWIRRVLSSITWQKPGIDFIRSNDYVINMWVLDQVNYYSAACEKVTRALDGFNKIANVMVVIGIALAAALICLELISDDVKTKFHVIWMTAEVFMGLFPVGAGMIAVYIQKIALEEHARQFSRMREVFSRGHVTLVTANEDQKIKIYVDLGCEVLSENVEWLLTNTDRPITLPAI